MEWLFDESDELDEYDFYKDQSYSNNENHVNLAYIELKKIISSIAGKAGDDKRHYNKSTELKYMILVFILKCILYFILKSSYDNGYPNSDL